MTSKDSAVRVCLLLIVLLLGVIAFKTFLQPAAVHGATPVEYKAIDFNGDDVRPLNELGKQGWHVVAVTQRGMACCTVYMEKSGPGR